jgi:hypothetical protein
VLLLERNGRLGTKILISGGGKCNITHDGTIDELLSAFPMHEQRFLRPAFHRYSNKDIRDLLMAGGVETAPRANGRVFPVNGVAKDVMRVFSRMLEQSGVTVRFHQRVEEFLLEGGRIVGVKGGGMTFSSHQVVLATGGASYPQTGTTGDGFVMAAGIGHRIQPVRPALAPIRISPPLPRDWQGVAIRGGVLAVIHDGKQIMRWQDDVLFTHEGLSGPAILEVSRAAALAMESGPVTLRMDVLPRKSHADIDGDLQELIRSQPGKKIATLLEGWLPNRIVEWLLRSIGVDPETRGHVVTIEARRAIARLLKEWGIGTVDAVLLERGEVTAGGVALSEVNPQTMESRRVAGLYLCGEVLDVAGPVGGYNLQAAFSTGFVAGDSAASAYLRR